MNLTYSSLIAVFVCISGSVNANSYDNEIGKYSDNKVEFLLPDNSVALEKQKCVKQDVAKVPQTYSSFKCLKVSHDGKEYLILENTKSFSQRKWQYKIISLGEQMRELGDLDAKYTVVPILVGGTRLEFLTADASKMALMFKKKKDIKVTYKRHHFNEIPSASVQSRNNTQLAARSSASSKGSTVTSESSTTPLTGSPTDEIIIKGSKEKFTSNSVKNSLVKASSSQINENTTHEFFVKHGFKRYLVESGEIKYIFTSRNKSTSTTTTYFDNWGWRQISYTTYQKSPPKIRAQDGARIYFKDGTKEAISAYSSSFISAVNKVLDKNNGIIDNYRNNYVQLITTYSRKPKSILGKSTTCISTAAGYPCHWNGIRLFWSSDYKEKEEAISLTIGDVNLESKLKEIDFSGAMKLPIDFLKIL